MAHNDNRTRNISISLTEEEYARLQERVAASGMIKTKYCRKALLEDLPGNSSDVSIKILNTQIAPIGRNLNSAYMALLKNGASPQVLAKMEHALEDFEMLVNEYRSNL